MPRAVLPFPGRLPCRRAARLIAGFLGAALASAAEPPIIARARAYLGTEAALQAVTSVHYEGTLVTASPADPNRPTSARLDIVYRRPEQQRITAVGEKTTETTALDDFEGWQRVQDRAHPAQWRQTLLPPGQVRRLRANTWENLGFFRGIEREGGSVEDLGPARIDDVACEKIAFRHSPTIIFFRYFALGDGRLVYTETESGGSIREQGEILAGGIRFPRVLTTQVKVEGQPARQVTITFDKITVNEAIPADFFAVPLVGPD